MSTQREVQNDLTHFEVQYVLQSTSLMFNKQCHYVACKHLKRDVSQVEETGMVTNTLFSSAAAVLHVWMYFAFSFSAITSFNIPFRCSPQVIDRIINNTKNIMNHFYMNKPMKHTGRYLEDKN